MKPIMEELRDAVQARYPLIYAHTAEEDRVTAVLNVLLKDLMPKGRISTWTCFGGLDSADDKNTRDPVKAMEFILKKPHEGFYIMKDLSAFMINPDVVRALRDAYYQFSAAAKSFLVIVSSQVVIPPELDKEMVVVEIPLPGVAEYIEEARRIETQYPKTKIPEEFHSQIGLSLRGLSLREAGHVMHSVLSHGNVTKGDLFDRIFSEKEKSLRKFGVLEYIPNRTDIANMGGLDVLKDWAIKRKNLFTQEAVDEHLPVPKGVLMMGISGCGKSMSCKAIAGLWNVPLFRLDMNMVFSGVFGNPHAAFHRALAGIEAVAPAVLWIDEVENAMGMTLTNHTSEQTLTFSSFLTWMQERPPLIFVAATANRIGSLPAEVIRKGRFDEVFFCDLPSEEERREIIEIHLRLNGLDPKGMNMFSLLYQTREWSGAEIEQAITAARIEAGYENRKLALEDIKTHMREVVPLSTTMSEQIREIREWSHYRAKRASKAVQKSMIPE